MKNYRQFLRFTIILLAILLTLSIAYGQSEEGEAGVLTNPLNAAGGPDPWLVYYEGYYYLSTTTGRSNLVMRRSETLAALKTATPIEIYAETDPSRCCNMWAPEFYLLEGEDGELHWYYYYSAGTSGTLDNQRTHVLESEGTDPMGPYTYKARIFDPANDVWAIDGSILELNDELYFLFSSWNGPNQNMYIAPMSNPWTISGERVLLSTPEYDWEKSGANVNEGPVALYHGDDVYIIYSASFCATADYKLGMITYLGGDPLDPASWEKHPEPVFERSEENSVFGPGHNGFFMSPDGTENWIVYHANDTVTGACDDWRTTRVQPFTWNEDGTPNFGEPVALGEEIAAPSGDEGIDPIPDFASLPVSMFRSYSYENGYLRHSDIYTRVDVSITPFEDAQFMIVPGLADPEAVSIVSVNLGGYYLRHEGNTIVFAPSDGSEEFSGDATWWLRPGLADSEWMSFESYNQPNFYIGQMFGVMALVELTDNLSDKAREDATFMQEEN